MSLYGMLRTGVSGMTAQSYLLGTVADNIANAGTTGYKRAMTEFGSLMLQNSSGSYTSGAVTTDVRYAISQQGPLAYTTSASDLAIMGNGFFVVSDPNGMSYLTRAGSFVVDGGTGNLVNTAGMTLMGYDISSGAAGGVLNGFGGLTPINLSDLNLQAKPSTIGVFKANLPSDAEVETGNTAADNLADSAYSEKSSIVTYDNLGKEVTLDVYMTKVGDNPAEWEYAVYNQADAAAGGGFPYTSGPLTTKTLGFDGMGALTTDPASMSVDIPGGQTLDIDLTGTTQLATDYTPITVSVDGNSPSTVAGVVIDRDGTVYATYENGARMAAFRLPLAYVNSADNLNPVAGNLFQPTAASGDVQIGFPTEGARGSVISGALEQSNVDMASELTEMIVAQRDYTANSKVFQTGSELLEVLMNLKR